MQVSMCDVVEYSLALESARSRAIETSNKAGAGSLQYNKDSLADLDLFLNLFRTVFSISGLGFYRI